jgi:F0F1-type ATP synthase membrane subunit b/b'
MKTLFTKQDIIFGIIILLILFNIINTNNIKTDVKAYKEKIEGIQVKVDSAKVINKQIDKKIGSVNEKVISITKEIHNIDKIITTIKTKTNEKVNNIDKLSNVELEQFFTSRYNKNQSSK